MAQRHQGGQGNQAPARAPIQVPLTKAQSSPFLLARSIQRAGRAYRLMADPVKPSLDRLVDPLAVFVGGNAAVSLGLCTFDHLLGDGRTTSVPEAIFKGAVYIGTYALANIKAIIPWMRYARQRQTTPSWLNHAKTWASVAGILLLWHGISTVTAYKRGFFAKADHVLSGNLVVDSIESAAGDLGELVDYKPAFASASVEPASVPASAVPILEQEPLDSLSHKAPEALPLATVQSDLDKISQKGVSLTLEHLVYLARTVYWEAANDATTPAALRKGMEGVASVIRNRWRYDNIYEQRFGGRPYSHLGGKSPFHIIVKKGGGTWQFTCVRDRPRYYYENYRKSPRQSGGQAMVHANRVYVAVGEMDRYQAQLAYQAVVDVLLRNVKDPTEKALFYMNPDRAQRIHRDNWGEGDGKKRTVQINSHVFYTVDGQNRDEWTESLL